MIGALANPRSSLPLLLMAALVVWVTVALLSLAPVPLNAGNTAPAGAEMLALENPDYDAGFDQVITIAVGEETQILVRTAHGSRHGDVRNCFQGPNDLQYFIEAGSGRVHVLCKVTETDFFDLIVKDRRSTSGYIEEVTVFKVNQYPTFTDFVNYLLGRARFPCTQILDDFMNAVIRFVFLP